MIPTNTSCPVGPKVLHLGGKGFPLYASKPLVQTKQICPLPPLPFQQRDVIVSFSQFFQNHFLHTKDLLDLSITLNRLTLASSSTASNLILNPLAKIGEHFWSTQQQIFNESLNASGFDAVRLLKRYGHTQPYVDYFQEALPILSMILMYLLPPYADNYYSIEAALTSVQKAADRSLEKIQQAIPIVSQSNVFKQKFREYAASFVHYIFEIISVAPYQLSVDANKVSDRAQYTFDLAFDLGVMLDNIAVRGIFPPEQRIQNQQQTQNSTNPSQKPVAKQQQSQETLEDDDEKNQDDSDEANENQNEENEGGRQQREEDAVPLSTQSSSHYRGHSSRGFNNHHTATKYFNTFRRDK